MKVKFKIILVIYIIIMLLLVMYYCKFGISNNKSRHLSDEFGYAHFSEITRYNYLLYPSLLYTHPQRVILKENEALWIPKGWWHWIESFDTIGINFWLTNIKENDKYEIPFIIKQKLSNKIVEEINIFKDVSIWDSYNDKIENKDVNKKNLQKNEIIITLPGYVKQFTRSKLNPELIKKVAPHIKIPELLEKIKDSEIDYNLWISNKFHDTGLHYDDTPSILYVLKGKKTVYITNPEQKENLYLKTFPSLPNVPLS